jgi:hypothetical protein
MSFCRKTQEKFASQNLFFTYNPQKVLIFHVVYFKKACLSAVYYAESFCFLQYNQQKVSLISQQNQSKKFENMFGPSSGASGVLIHEKNPDQKILFYNPFKYRFATVQYNASGSF